MKIRYRKLPDLLNPAQYSYYPYLQVSVRYSDRKQPILALIDSGAVDSLFPESLGVPLGIDVPSGERKIYFGIGGRAVTGFLHNVDLQIQGFDAWVRMKVGFINTVQIPLLGQSGFFENYQIIFERFRYQIEIYPRIDALVRGRRGRRKP